MKPSTPLLLLFLALAPILGCGGGEGGGPPDPASYFLAQPPYGVAACDGQDGRLAGRRELRLFWSGPVDLVAHSRGLQRYYRRHGLEFFSAAPAQPMSPGYVLDTDSAALDAALAREFPGVDLSNEAALMRDPALYDRVVGFAANFLMGPMVEFATAHSERGGAVTNLVVLPQITRPGGMSLSLGPGMLAGLAVSPRLLEALDVEDPQAARVWRGVKFPPGFSPMMFLDATVIGGVAAREPVIRDLVAAHEFGHASGLVHRGRTHNLMYPNAAPGLSVCGDVLDDDQLAAMRSALALEPAAGQSLTARPRAEPAAALAADARFSPASLRALRRGDARVLRAWLAPLLDRGE